MRLLLVSALLAASCLSGVPATEPASQDEIMAAARMADAVYQRHLRETAHKLSSDDVAVRLAALAQLQALGDIEAIDDVLPFVIAATRTSDELVAGCLAISHLGSQRAVAPLRALLTHRDERVRVAATNALDFMQKAAIQDTLPKVSETNDTLRLAAVTVLSREQVADAAERLEKALAGDSRLLVRRAAAIALGKLGDKTRAKTLRDSLCDPDAGVRRYAAEALVKLDDKHAIPHLLMALEANIAGDHINRSLILLSGQDFGFNPRAGVGERTLAVERGFVWWGENAKNFPQ
jgi:HEAT repeat protein